MRRDDGRGVPNSLCQAIAGQPLTVYGDGPRPRSFCYVDDLVDGLYRLVQADFHEPVNLGNPAEMTIAELGEVVNRLTGNSTAMQLIPDARAPADPQQRTPAIRRAQEVLDWEPTTPLERGLQNT